MAMSKGDAKPCNLQAITIIQQSPFIIINAGVSYFQTHH